MGAKIEIYNDIVARLIAKVPELKTIGKWNNQFENTGKEEAFKYPACFISYSSLQWDAAKNITAGANQLQAQQMGNSIITIYLGFEQYVDETDSWPLIEPIIHKVWQYLQGYAKAGQQYYGPFMRIEEREDSSHDSVIIWAMDFTCQVSELTSIGDLVDAAPVTLVLNKDLIIDPSTSDNLRTGNDFS